MQGHIKHSFLPPAGRHLVIRLELQQENAKQTKCCICTSSLFIQALYVQHYLVQIKLLVTTL